MTGAALLAGLALAAAGCGGSGGNGKQASSGEQARTSLEDATAKTLRSTMHVDLAVALRQVGAQGHGVYGATGDFGPTGGRFEIDQRELGGSLRQEVVSRRDGHLILYNDVANVPLPKGKSWLRLDLTRYGIKRYGVNTAFLAGADQDPTAALALATSPAATVKDLGRDRLGGEALERHFRARVDVVAVAKARGLKPKALQRLAADVGPRVQTIDVWLGDQGRLARVEVKKRLRDANGGQLEQISIANFSKYGEEVRVTLPPPAKVEDFFKLAR